MEHSPDLRDPRLGFVFDSLTAASHLARRIQESAFGATLEKSDHSPVTVADYSVQALLARSLTERFPGEPLVAEESSPLLAENPAILEHICRFLARDGGSPAIQDVLAWIDYGGGQPGEGFWTLDPIDGTKGFLRGGQFAVALAWIAQGEVQVAGLGCPRLGRAGREKTGLIYVAVRNQGCWRAVLGSRAFEKCTVSGCRDLREARILRSVEKAHTNLDLFGRLLTRIGSSGEPLLMDSQAKYAALASGWGDAVIRLQSRPEYREKIWDQAAGSLVVEEAGGRVTDQAGRTLDFRQGKRLERNRGVVATNGSLHGELIGLLQQAALGTSP